MAGLQLPQVRYATIPLTGGLDQVTPTLSLKPGVVREAKNFEASITGGYTRIAGYERFSGKTSPSAATYSVFTITLTGAIAVGNTITGATSAATAQVIAIAGNAYIVTKVSGAFTVSEAVKVGGSNQGTLTAFGSTTLTIDTQKDGEYTALAADAYRADIAAVPGSGPIRGVAYLNGVVYAWRNNAGGTALALYKSTASGWSAVSLGYELSFATGTAEILEGVTVTGATSGASAVVKRVVLQAGDWTTGDAEGRLIFASVTGTFQNGENLQVSGVTKAVSGGAQAAITLLPGGRVEVDVASFGGGFTKRIYGADGKNRGFEFDGTTYVPIVTGMTDDTPDHVVVHKQHLFFSFGPSLQFSSIGTPYQWSAILGAGEISAQEDITCMLVQPGDQSTGALAVYSANNTSILYGSSSENFALSSFNLGTGARAYTAQNMSLSFVFEDRGIMNLQTSLNYGNFDTAALTLNIRPFVQQRRNLVTASSINREKSQYRVFFSDGYGLYMTVVNGQLVGVMPVVFTDVVRCMCAGETPDGVETSFFGSDDGYVYRLDAGTSFDGDAIDAVLELVFNAIGSPRAIKRYRKASFEINGETYADFDVSYVLGYASAYIEQSATRNYTTSLTGSSYWDTAVWDSFVWDGVTLAPSEIELDGSGENISLRVRSNSAAYAPFTINSMIIHYSIRRGLR